MCVYIYNRSDVHEKSKYDMKRSVYVSVCVTDYLWWNIMKYSSRHTLRKRKMINLDSTQIFFFARRLFSTFALSVVNEERWGPWTPAAARGTPRILPRSSIWSALSLQTCVRVRLQDCVSFASQPLNTPASTKRTCANIHRSSFFFARTGWKGPWLHIDKNVSRRFC